MELLPSCRRFARDALRGVAAVVFIASCDRIPTQRSPHDPPAVMSLTRTIDPEDGSPGELDSIASVAIDDSGYVYALTLGPERLMVFAPDGGFVRVLARGGDGPGDVRAGFLAISGDTVLVQQPQQARLSAFRRGGQSVGSFRTSCCMNARQLLRDSSGHLWVPGSLLVNGEPGWVRFDAQLQKRDVVRMPRDPDLAWPPATVTASAQLDGRNVTAFAPIPLQPSMRTVPLPSGSVLAARTDRAEVRVMKNGATVLRTPLPLPSLSISARQRDSVVHSMFTLRFGVRRLEVAWDRAALIRAVPSHWPRFSDVAVDLGGRIWIAAPTAEGPSTRLLGLTPNGDLLVDAPMPHPRLFDGYWARDQVVVPDVDIGGRPVIHVFAIRLGSPRKGQ
jgi:hypothetical protein